MLVVATVVVGPERAGAAVGDLGFAGCLADDPAGSGCDDLGPAGPEGSLAGVDSVVAGADGISLYTVGNAPGDIGVLNRFRTAPGGDLSPAECDADSPAGRRMHRPAARGTGGPAHRSARRGRGRHRLVRVRHVGASGRSRGGSSSRERTR